MRSLYQINASEKDIFEQYYQYTNFFLKEKLTDNQIKIISQLAYYYLQSEGAKETIRWQWTFSQDTRNKIKESLDLDSNNFNTYLSGMRKKTLSDGSLVIEKHPDYEAINPKLVVKPGEIGKTGKRGFQLLVNFFINEEVPEAAPVTTPSLPEAKKEDTELVVTERPEEDIQKIIRNAQETARRSRENSEGEEHSDGAGAEHVEDSVPLVKTGNVGSRPTRRSEDLRPAPFQGGDAPEDGEIRPELSENKSD
ncbi:MAG TPA: hypothetical protein DCY51_11245 [Bacteroidetes bacterium]|nr:hypothetical protein [Bacteroidota bacterium]